MMDKADIERVSILAGRAQRVPLTADEKGEMRRLLAKRTPRAQDLAWDDLLAATYVFLGAYFMGALPENADAVVS
ncbi:MAG: hypothetical protein V4510_00090 [bacterium]